MSSKKLQKYELEELSTHLPFRVLNPHEAQKFYDVRLYKTEPGLEPFVQLYWVMRWNLAPDESFAAEVIPSAYTNFTCMPGGPRITGVTTGLYRYTVQGSGTIFGVMFKPGGFAPFYDKPLSHMTDTFIPTVRVFEGATDAFNERVLQSDDETGITLMTNLLLQKNPKNDSNITLVNRIIERSQSEQVITVAERAKEFSMHERSLQKLFTSYVGVGLKWIMLRNRLQSAAFLAESLEAPHWTQIAQDLGYSDQSHFINDFKRIAGMTPRQYASILYRK